MTTTDRIDVHQHVLPPRYADWLRGKGIRPGGIDLRDWSPSAALKFMDGHGIATGVLSVSTPGVHLGDDAEARKWARGVNEYTADLVRADPGRFGLFATLPLPDAEGAIAEAGYALDSLHADGVVLLANNAGRYLGDPGFTLLLAYLHSRQATVFVHPGELPAEPVPGIPSFTADFLLDTTRTAISLILSGAMKKYDGIKFILAHAGGFVPYIAYRILLTMVSRRTEPGGCSPWRTRNTRCHACLPPQAIRLRRGAVLDPGGAAQPPRDRRAHACALRQRLPLRPTRRGRLHGQPV
jgi:6-methylsalicylate decarboxylase